MTQDRIFFCAAVTEASWVPDIDYDHPYKDSSNKLQLLWETATKACCSDSRSAV